MLLPGKGVYILAYVCMLTHVKGGRTEADDDREDSGRMAVLDSHSLSGKSLLGL